MHKSSFEPNNPLTKGVSTEEKASLKSWDLQISTNLEYQWVKDKNTNSKMFQRTDVFEPISRDESNPLTKQTFRVKKTTPFRVYETEPPQNRPNLPPPQSLIWNPNTMDNTVQREQ